jgi:hypothetical protein
LAERVATTLKTWFHITVSPAAQPHSALLLPVQSMVLAESEAEMGREHKYSVAVVEVVNEGHRRGHCCYWCIGSGSQAASTAAAPAV